MTQEARYWRLRIRNQADTADDLVVSSYSEATPYLISPPEGDGQSFDPLTGVSTVGVYTGEVADYDADTAATPLVTGLLADAAGRYQALSRRAYWEWSSDGSTWNELVGGYVNSIRLVRPKAFAITVGETRRIAQRSKVWSQVSTSFDNATNVIGAPIRQGFGPMPAIETWSFLVTDVTGEMVTLQFKNGWIREADGWVYRGQGSKAILGETYRRINSLLRHEFMPSLVVGSTTINHGWFPGVNIELYETDGTTLNSIRQPISKSVTYPGSVLWEERNVDDNVISYQGELTLYWPDSQPTVDDLFLVYGYSTTISEANPLHIAMHPIDIETGHWTDLGVAYDSTAAAATKSALGHTLRVLLRITEPMLLEDVQAMLRGLFGYGARRNGNGQEVLFVSRLRNRDLPTTELTTANVPGWEGVIFDLDEQSICNVVTARQHRLVLWTEDDGGERPPDDILMVPQTRRVELNSEGGATPDWETLGEREQLYELPGTVCRFTFIPLALRFSYVPVDFDTFSEAIATEIFDRYGRGGPTGALEVIGTTITESVGEEVKLTLPHQVNASTRGGTRCVQIIKRTEIPSGARLEVLDSGSTSQLATAPTFTLGDGSDTRKIAKITFTNAATLNAADIVLTVEVGFTDGATPDAGIREFVYGLGLDDVPATVELTPVDAGATVWVRMRAVQPNRRPGAWTAWVSHALDALDPPNTLALSEATPDGGILATWAVGANATDIPIDVYLNSTAATPTSIVDRLPAASVSTKLYPSGTGIWAVGVRHREAPPYGGLSALVYDDVTTTITETLDPPTDPLGIGGNGNGVYGLSVTAVEFPSSVEFSEAVEDSYDAGTYGGYAVVATLPSQESGLTTWTGSVADDRLRRKVRARHTRDGATASSYTAEQVVWPWYAYPVTT